MDEELFKWLKTYFKWMENSLDVWKIIYVDEIFEIPKIELYVGNHE